MWATEGVKRGESVIPEEKAEAEAEAEVEAAGFQEAEVEAWGQGSMDGDSGERTSRGQRSCTS